MATIHMSALQRLFQPHTKTTLNVGEPYTITLYDPKRMTDIFHNTLYTLYHLRHANTPVNLASNNELAVQLLQLTDTDIPLLSARYALDSCTHQFIIRANNRNQPFATILPTDDVPSSTVIVQHVVPRSVTDVAEWITRKGGVLHYARTHDVRDITEQELMQLVPQLTNEMPSCMWHIPPAINKQRVGNQFDRLSVMQFVTQNVNNTSQFTTDSAIDDLVGALENGMLSVIISPKSHGDYKNIMHEQTKRKINKLEKSDVLTQLHDATQRPHPGDLEHIQNVLRFQSRPFRSLSDVLTLIERCTLMSMFDIYVITQQKDTLQVTDEKAPMNNPEDIANLVDRTYYMKTNHIISI